MLSVLWLLQCSLYKYLVTEVCRRVHEHDLFICSLPKVEGSSGSSDKVETSDEGISSCSLWLGFQTSTESTVPQCRVAYSHGEFVQEICKPGEWRKAGNLLHEVRILPVASVGNLVHIWKISYQKFFYCEC